ncbi:MAG: V-type ATP synthase subunit D [Thermoproteota archaeon]
MSLRFKPTRFELLKLNRLLNVASRSSKILQQRYHVLNQELLETRNELKRLGLDINRELLKTYKLIEDAEKELGEDVVKRAAATTVRLNDVNIKWEEVRGVLIPRVLYSKLLPSVEDRGYYPLETSEKVDKASEEMHRFLTILLDYVNLLTCQRILMKELGKIEQRSKALDHVIIPNLVAQRKRILSKLEENEREEMARKKKIKEFLESRG